MKRLYGKRFLSVIAVLAAAALVVWGGRLFLHPETVRQDSWRILEAQAVPEGLSVRTVGQNLMLLPGVKVKADSEEGPGFEAEWVRDGVSDDAASRWSSANDWESCEHWLQVSFPETVTVGVVRLFWERDNACDYALEYSADGRTWETAAAFADRPEKTVQDIVLDAPVTARRLRLHVRDVAKEEADLSLYYQNVSLLELEVYAGVEASFVVERPQIPAAERRQLAASTKALDAAAVCAVLYPSVPDGYALRFLGADYEMLVDAEGRIADTAAETCAELGFALEKDGVSHELPGMAVWIPAAENAADSENAGSPAEADTAADGTGAQETAGRGPGPSVLPEGYSVMEWQPGAGSYALSGSVRVAVPEAQREALSDAAALFAEEIAEQSGASAELVLADIDAVELTDGTGRAPDGALSAGAGGQDSDILLMLLPETEGWPDGLGEEGFRIELGTGSGADARILARTVRGLRWGCVSFLELLEKGEGILPRGRIADYPRYSVRGFGIDVGRRPVSLELLYEIARELSAHKMNTLQVHLNDNQIIAQSGYDGTLEGAYGLYAGFRLESDLRNEAGEGITSSDLYYTKEDFARLISDAAALGVSVVPEIDTPAHSLALTKRFPELGLSGDPESADQLDISRPEAVELGKRLWEEFLAGNAPESGTDGNVSSGVFGDCTVVHIGMDEYYGDGDDYISYLNGLAAYIGQIAPDKTVRFWGSLSKIAADHSGVSTGLQMQIWNTDWADPEDMYAEGFPVINSLSDSLYIIPGGGYDRLDCDFLRERWQPNVFEAGGRTWTIPAWSERMLGACYMMWNDWSHLNGETISEAELFDRFREPLPILAEKLWGGISEIGTCANQNHLLY